MTEEQAYELMCSRCPDAKRCHDDCEVCEEFLAATNSETVNECQSCGHRFSEPQEHWEAREMWGGLGCELVLGCPRCGGGYIEIRRDAQDGEDGQEL